MTNVAFLVGLHNEEPDLYINGDINDTITVVAMYNHGYSEIFDKACRAMEGLEQCIRLYEEFYHESINFFCAVDKTQILHAPYLEEIDVAAKLKEHH
jgi:hypothetical protein